MIHVYGSGILASVTVKCLARWGHAATLDNDSVEPGDVVWLAYDTCVDSTGNADVDQLQTTCTDILTTLPNNMLVLVSSQVPVGFTRRLHQQYPELVIVSAPENLRQSHAIADFLNPARVVIGTHDGKPNESVVVLYSETVHSRFMWMSYESAEMTKHTLNAFLATSIAFANELAAICEITGAEYDDVLRASLADPRIGRQAYLKAGPSSGAHLLRDIRYLLQVQPSAQLLTDVLTSQAWQV